ncbi:MAG: hypothetical protein QM811_00640 [Pirellulales bacterium]
MDDPRQALAELLRKDPRYKLEAYAFVFDALSYAHETLGMGLETSGETEPGGKRKRRATDQPPERHLTGRELCEAIRVYALEQFGYMARCVLGTWGVRTTGDFGEIVFNLIRIRQMRKTKQDRREDFDDIYDFEEAFVRDFKITAN